MVRSLTAIILALLGSVSTAGAEPPRRVVSMNVCTDQMAMLIASPGQLHSVSYLASDKGSSALAAEAGSYAVNHGLAEEIFLMQPDLVIAGTFTTRATVSLLRRLGIPVEEFAPESSFDDVRANLTRMGDVLGQPERAAELIAELDSKLAEYSATARPDLTVATWYANSYTSGSGTLVDAVIKASGMTNLAAKLGYTGTARLPLEMLILANPDLIAGGGRDYTTPALAQQHFEHPAFHALTRDSVRVDVPARYTVCGAPFTAEAVRLLSEAAKTVKPQ